MAREDFVDLKLEHHTTDGIEVVDVEGEIDVYTAPRLRELLIDLVNGGHYLLHVHHELVVPAVHEIHEKLTQPGGGIDVDLAFDVDDLNPVRRVMLQLQVHKILPRHAVFRRRLCWRHARCPPRGMGTPSRIQSRADVMS